MPFWRSRLEPVHYQTGKCRDADWEQANQMERAHLIFRALRALRGKMNDAACQFQVIARLKRMRTAQYNTPELPVGALANPCLLAAPPYFQVFVLHSCSINARVTRPIKEYQDFIQQFDFLYRALRQRLTTFTSNETCGHWNALVLDDLRSDVVFNRTAAELHESIVDQTFAVNRPTTDGLGILNVTIDFELSICVDFQLWLFVERGRQLGQSASPSRFSVKRSLEDENTFHASVGCGIRDNNGHFWYPRNNTDYGRFDSAPEHDEGWGFFFAKTFGDGTLSNWLKTRNIGQ